MPDGATYSYTYEHNELRNIRIPGAGNINYPSYSMGRPDSVTFPGSSRSYSYDALLRLEDINSTQQNAHYNYDTVGNILTKQTEHGNYGYEYDDLYRLTDIDNPTHTDEAYTYDPVGNRLTATGVSGSIEHNQNNELRLYGDISFDYDANGNTISKTSASESWVYGYNVQNRLVRVEEDGLLIAEYGDDPFGRRLWKEVDGTRTYFFYSDEGLIAEYDENGVEIRSYGYKPDSTWTTDPLWLKEGGEYYWYQNDHLGTPQKLTGSTGTVVWSATYSAFGDASIDIELISNNLRFSGQYYDAETGVHYNYHRYYEPRTGRYTRVDPLGFDGGDVNLYAYVWNNPVNRVDPLGLLWVPSHFPREIPPVTGMEKRPELPTWTDTKWAECWGNCIEKFRFDTLVIPALMSTMLPKKAVPPFRVVVKGDRMTTFLSATAHNVVRPTAKMLEKVAASTGSKQIANAASRAHWLKASMRGIGRTPWLWRIGTGALVFEGFYDLGLVFSCAEFCVRNSSCSLY